MGYPGPPDQESYDRLSARVESNRADVEQLIEAVAAASRRAQASEAQADQDRLRLDDLEERADVDRALIEALQAEGILGRNQIDNLESALASSRTIGAAIGIIMNQFKVTETMAFAALSRASQDTNRKLRDVAGDLVRTGDVSGLSQR